MYCVRIAASVVLFFSIAGFSQEPAKKVSKSEALEAATFKAFPVYPPMARQLRIEGSVEVEAIISESGAVETVNILSGNPLLTKPAAEAVKKWKFKPFQVDGKAARVLAPFGFKFRYE